MNISSGILPPIIRMVINVYYMLIAYRPEGAGRPMQNHVSFWFAFSFEGGLDSFFLHMEVVDSRMIYFTTHKTKSSLFLNLTKVSRFLRLMVLKVLVMRILVMRVLVIWLKIMLPFE